MTSTIQPYTTTTTAETASDERPAKSDPRTDIEL